MTPPGQSSPPEKGSAWSGGSTAGGCSTLKALLRDDEQPGPQTREQLTGAVAELRAAGAAQNVLRGDVAATDILMALAGVTLVAGDAAQRAQAERLLDLVMDAVTRPDTWQDGAGA